METIWKQIQGDEFCSKANQSPTDSQGAPYILLKENSIQYEAITEEFSRLGAAERL